MLHRCTLALTWCALQSRSPAKAPRAITACTGPFLTRSAYMQRSQWSMVLSSAAPPFRNQSASDWRLLCHMCTVSSQEQQRLISFHGQSPTYTLKHCFFCTYCIKYIIIVQMFSVVFLYFKFVWWHKYCDTILYDYHETDFRLHSIIWATIHFLTINFVSTFFAFRRLILLHVLSTRSYNNYFRRYRIFPGLRH